jgi:hypothetical protein
LVLCRSLGAVQEEKKCFLGRSGLARLTCKRGFQIGVGIRIGSGIGVGVGVGGGIGIDSDTDPDPDPDTDSDSDGIIFFNQVVVGNRLLTSGGDDAIWLPQLPLLRPSSELLSCPKAAASCRSPKPPAPGLR